MAETHLELKTDKTCLKWGNFPFPCPFFPNDDTHHIQFCFRPMWRSYMCLTLFLFLIRLISNQFIGLFLDFQTIWLLLALIFQEVIVFFQDQIKEVLWWQTDDENEFKWFDRGICLTNFFDLILFFWISFLNKINRTLS